MKQLKYLMSAILLICFVNIVSAQSAGMDPETYKSERETLLSQKESLLKEKTELQNSIYDLTIQLGELDVQLDQALTKHYVKKYGKEDGSRVAMGQIWKGMTEQMMRDSWGEPDKTNTDKYSYGVFKQLYYGKVIYFFRDNKLIDWEEEK